LTPLAPHNIQLPNDMATQIRSSTTQPGVEDETAWDTDSASEFEDEPDLPLGSPASSDEDTVMSEKLDIDDSRCIH